MRITGGTARGRKLYTPGRERTGIRPTGDRVREALFNILGGSVLQARVLDLFCGTGSVGLEALSRGAVLSVFVDYSQPALEMVRRSLLRIFPDRPAAVIRLDLSKKNGISALRAHRLCQEPFDLVFLDPPYEKKLAQMALTVVDKTGLVRPGGTMVAEERWKTPLPDQVGRLTLRQHRRYGETALWFYRAEQDEPEQY